MNKVCSFLDKFAFHFHLQNPSLRATIPNEIPLLLDLSTVDADERLRKFLLVKKELAQNLALCDMRTEEEFNIAMTTGATVFKASPFKMEEFLQADQLVDQSEEIPRFVLNGRKRKRSDKVAEKVQRQECDVRQPEKKMRPSVSDNLRTIKGNEIPLNKDCYETGLVKNQAKFRSKRKDPSRSSINILRLVKRSDNYYTCEVKNSAQQAQKQSTRDHSTVSCVGQNLGANSLSRKRKCSAQVACLDKIGPLKIKIAQQTTKYPALECPLSKNSAPSPKAPTTCKQLYVPLFNEKAPAPSVCQAPEPALNNKEPENKARNLFEVLQRMKRALAKDRSNKKERKGPVRTPTFVRIRKQVGNLFEMRARIISRNLRS